MAPPAASSSVSLLPGLVGLAAVRAFFPWEALAHPRPIHFAICFAAALAARVAIDHYIKPEACA